MKTVAAHTLGCKVNLYDTEAVLELFRQNGYSVVPFGERADVYIINTCTVTNLGDRKSRQALRRAVGLNKDAVVCAIGCYAQTAPGEVAKIPGVDLILGTKERERIVELVEREVSARSASSPKAYISDVSRGRGFEGLRVKGFSERQRAFVKIQDGCDNFCSFCIVPYARGRAVSRGLPEIIEEVRGLAANGYKEIVLSGIHVASYGRGSGESGGLIGVLEAVSAVGGVERIRMSSLEPTLFTEEFTASLRGLPKLCDHFHLSLQSGSDSVLSRMNRKYTADGYRQSVALIRAAYPTAAITTDVIVGFPAETDAEFAETMAFAREIGFADIHVFPYSPKKGTPAAAMAGQTPQAVKRARAEELSALAAEMRAEFLRNAAGTERGVLFERRRGDGRYEGYTENYINVLSESDRDMVNEIVKVRITGAREGYCVGETTPARAVTKN